MEKGMSPCCCCLVAMGAAAATEPDLVHFVVQLLLD